MCLPRHQAVTANSVQKVFHVMADADYLLSLTPDNLPPVPTVYIVSLSTHERSLSCMWITTTDCILCMCCIGMTTAYMWCVPKDHLGMSSMTAVYVVCV